MSQNTTLKPLLLHAHAGKGPNPPKVAVALEILGVPYEVKLWDFGPADNGVKGERFTKINPNGRVPALEDPNTGVTAWESQAIINYLLRQYDGGKKLQPWRSEQERVTAESFESLMLSTLGPMQGQTVWFTHHHPTPNPDALKRYQEQTYRVYGVFEEQLGKSDGKTIVPGGVAPVDLHLYGWVRTHPYAGISLDKYPKVKAWLEAFGGRPEVEAAYAKLEAGQHA